MPLLVAVERSTLKCVPSKEGEDIRKPGVDFSACVFFHYAAAVYPYYMAAINPDRGYNYVLSPMNPSSQSPNRAGDL